jgi:carbamoyl-phosphate synthase small subunit
MKGILLLEDGTVFTGEAFGARGHRCGEVVFNTGMTGYQEILTDPSYNEQIITMTYPLIGNYGTGCGDNESRRVHAGGLVVKEACGFPSSWRSEEPLGAFLKRHDVIGLQGVDTRMLVRHIRIKGAMNGVISAGRLGIESLRKKLAEYPGLVDRDIVKDVTAAGAYRWSEPVTDLSGRRCDYGRGRFRVVAVDYGIKHNILRLLCSHGCELKVVPAAASAARILSHKPHGVFLSNGPGDPAPVGYAIETVRKLLGKVPIFGICLGHQILALALGGRTYKLKFGHRGSNHPVKNLRTGRIEITSQNHGFCVDMDSLSSKDVELTHLNLNDRTNEGLRCERLKAFSVQYHPEASPGPHDSSYLFGEFAAMMAGRRK